MLSSRWAVLTSVPHFTACSAAMGFVHECAALQGAAHAALQPQTRRGRQGWGGGRRTARGAPTFAWFSLVSCSSTTSGSSLSMSLVMALASCTQGGRVVQQCGGGGGPSRQGGELLRAPWVCMHGLALGCKRREANTHRSQTWVYTTRHHSPWQPHTRSRRPPSSASSSTKRRSRR